MYFRKSTTKRQKLYPAALIFKFKERDTWVWSMMKVQKVSYETHFFQVNHRSLSFCFFMAVLSWPLPSVPLPSLKSQRENLSHSFPSFSFSRGWVKAPTTLRALPDRIQSLVSIACTWNGYSGHLVSTINDEFVSLLVCNTVDTFITSYNVFACHRGSSEFLMSRLSHRTSYKW